MQFQSFLVFLEKRSFGLITSHIVKHFALFYSSRNGVDQSLLYPIIAKQTHATHGWVQLLWFARKIYARGGARIFENITLHEFSVFCMFGFDGSSDAKLIIMYCSFRTNNVAQLGCGRLLAAANKTAMVAISDKAWPLTFICCIESTSCYVCSLNCCGIVFEINERNSIVS